MKLSNKELNKIMMKADDDLDKLKDKCHELYEENKELKNKLARIENYVRSQITYYYDEDLDESVYQDEMSGARVLEIIEGDDK